MQMITALITSLRKVVERSGGKLLSRGEFCPGCLYAYAADPDRYEVEIWYE